MCSRRVIILPVQAWFAVAFSAIVSSCHPGSPDTLRMTEERKRLNFGGQTELNFEWRFHELGTSAERRRPVPGQGNPLAELFANEVAVEPE